MSYPTVTSDVTAHKKMVTLTTGTSKGKSEFTESSAELSMDHVKVISCLDNSSKDNF